MRADGQRSGPGPNVFSASSDNVWVDPQGRLHLRITRVAGRWECAEVVGAASLGYGTYTWTLDSRVDDIDPQAVLGLFTWSDAPAFAHREIDIEFSRWGWPSSTTNAQYVVQPHRAPGHLRAVTQPAAGTSRHSFTWAPGSVAFTSSTGQPASWLYSAADVPPPGSERPRMNLWLLDGRAPTDRTSVEVVIRSFGFTPLPGRSASVIALPEPLAIQR